MYEETKQRSEDLTATDILKACEVLRAASYPITSYKAVYPKPIPPVPQDTYTLIPNGTEFSKRGNPKGEVIPSYLVQHDQTGETTKYFGSSSIWYTEVCADYFGTFASWFGVQRNNWKKEQLKLIEQNRSKKEEDTMFSYSEAAIRIARENDLYIINDILEDWCDCCYADDYQDYVQAKAIKMNANYAAASVSTPTPTDQRQRDYLLGRLEELKNKKYDELHAHFKLDPVDGPKTLKELVEKIKSEDYTVEEKYLDRKFYYSYDVLTGIRWSKDKADQDGFNKAIELRDADYQSTKDIIVIKSPEEGFEALKQFESKTFH